MTDGLCLVSCSSRKHAGTRVGLESPAGLSGYSSAPLGSGLSKPSHHRKGIPRVGRFRAWWEADLCPREVNQGRVAISRRALFSPVQALHDVCVGVSTKGATGGSG